MGFAKIINALLLIENSSITQVKDKTVSLSWVMFVHEQSKIFAYKIQIYFVYMKRRIT